jgi:hypothetical protein
MHPSSHTSAAEHPWNSAAQTADMEVQDKPALDQLRTRRNPEVRNPQSPVDEPYVVLFPPLMKLSLNLNQLLHHLPQNQ